MIFLIVRTNTGELKRRFFEEVSPWQEVIDYIKKEEAEVVDCFKSETMTASCFKDYFRYLNGRNNYIERQTEAGGQPDLWRSPY